MTIYYSSDITENSLKCFLKTLFYWKGSLWKAIYKELITWCLAYTTLSLISRLALNKEQLLIFDKVCYLCYNFGSLLPVSFMLGFYVSLALSRWQMVTDNLPFPDTLSIYIAEYVNGRDERSQFIRRSVARYVATSQVLIFRDFSTKARKMFPSVDSIKEKGYLTEEEYQKLMLASTKTIAPWWIPVQWALDLIISAEKENRLNNGHFGVQDCVKVILANRKLNHNLLILDWFPIPLAYTQIVALTVRIYFWIACLGRQFLRSEPFSHMPTSKIDVYVPILSIVQLIFFMGWLKVGEALVNPFGTDDDDSPVQFVLGRNLNAGLGIIDDGTEFKVKIVGDCFYKKPDFLDNEVVKRKSKISLKIDTEQKNETPNGMPNHSKL
uniref:Bestrophin homolog n=1 Tax=Strongyloides venezuelensis TaxID=75913 RepID=A0A0K0FVH0_STRVS